MPPVTGLVIPVTSTPEPGSPRHPMWTASASPLLSSAQRLVDSMRASPDGRADAEALQDLQRQMELLQPGLSTPSGPPGAGPSSSRMPPTEVQAHPGPSGEPRREEGGRNNSRRPRRRRPKQSQPRKKPAAQRPPRASGGGAWTVSIRTGLTQSNPREGAYWPGKAGYKKEIFNGTRNSSTNTWLGH